MNNKKYKLLKLISISFIFMPSALLAYPNSQVEILGSGPFSDIPTNIKNGPASKKPSFFYSVEKLLDGSALFGFIKNNPTPKRIIQNNNNRRKMLTAFENKNDFPLKLFGIDYDKDLIDEFRKAAKKVAEEMVGSDDNNRNHPEQTVCSKNDICGNTNNEEKTDEDDEQKLEDFGQHEIFSKIDLPSTSNKNKIVKLPYPTKKMMISGEDGNQGDNTNNNGNSDDDNNGNESDIGDSDEDIDFTPYGKKEKPEGLEAIEDALLSGDFQYLKPLIAKGAPAIKDCLNKAAEAKNTQLLEELLDIINEHLSNKLMERMLKKNVKKYLNNEIDDEVNLNLQECKECLYLAIKLAKKFQDITVLTQKTFMTAVDINDLALFELLFTNVSNNFDLNQLLSDYFQPVLVLNRAAGNGNLEVLKWLIEKFSLTPNTMFTLYQAASSGNLTMVKWLIETYNLQPLQETLNKAVESKNKDLINYLLDPKFGLHATPYVLNMINSNDHNNTENPDLIDSDSNNIWSKFCSCLKQINPFSCTCKRDKNKDE